MIYVFAVVGLFVTTLLSGGMTLYSLGNYKKFLGWGLVMLVCLAGTFSIITLKPQPFANVTKKESPCTR